MQTLGYDELNKLAKTVADEIRKGFSSYDGKKWQKVSGKEQAVKFDVDVPSLKGQKVSDLNPQGRLGANFDARLWLAGGQYVDGYLRGQTLHGVRYTLEVVGDEYTGRVIVSDGSSAWDYDL